ncbi:nucleotidyltransferase family protein [Deinococcus sonorensis]|uniref:Nucleotidyltransferase family protein n=2 Tax=Deinococcus sonorensis TaxID=309891 RepID=A0AAU7UCZ6_9DEIO
MTDAEFLAAIQQNPVNAAILERLPDLGLPDAQLVAGALFGTVWNLQGGEAPTRHIRDYDLFYWDPDTSYAAEDRQIQRAEQLFRDLKSPIELRNQARVHLWFPERHGVERPPLLSVQEGIDQFLVRCTCLGVNAAGEVYAPCGLSELEAGVLRPNPRNHTPHLYAAKVQSYRERWPWLTDAS